MADDANLRSRESSALASILSRAGLPNAPLAMPKQVLENQSNWLFAIYARLVRRY